MCGDGQPFGPNGRGIPYAGSDLTFSLARPKTARTAAHPHTWNYLRQPFAVSSATFRLVAQKEDIVRGRGVSVGFSLQFIS